MGQYRKKPVVVEAERFWPAAETWPDGVVEYNREAVEDAAGNKSTWFAWRIQTPEGPHEVTPGDWIITGIKGEKYPCNPDIFEATYDPV